MGKPKLIYFDTRGRAELTRYVFAQAGVDYEDVRLTKEEWQKLKPEITFGQLPVLEINGERIGQSVAICRYVAKEHGLAGKDNWTAAKADEIGDSITDLINKFMPVYRCEDEDEKKRMMTAFMSETASKFLANFTKVLETRGGKWLAGNELTWADIAFAATMEGMSTMVGDEWRKAAPSLADLVDRVFAQPKIKNWRETRPKTQG